MPTGVPKSGKRAKIGEGKRSMENAMVKLIGTSSKKKIAQMAAEAKAAIAAEAVEEKRELKPVPVEDQLLAHARNSLAVYIGLVHRTDDGKPAIPPAHLRNIVIPAIENDALGDTVIILPPGGAKTNTLIGAVCQWLGQDPTQHLAYICDSGPQAEKRSLAIRDVIEADPTYRTIFPNTKPNKSRGWAADAWFLNRPNRMDKNPSLLAVGQGGGIIGTRLHKVVYDDLANEENQKTDLQRKAIWTFLARTGKTRMHPEKGRQIMLGTRWGEEDPIGYCLDRGWTAIHVPALDDNNESYWPEYYPTTYLACKNDEHNPDGQCCMKKELGSLEFTRTFMGYVYSDETSRFKRGWWRYFDEDPNLPRGCITVDTAGWDNTSVKSDFCALQVTSSDGHDAFVLDVTQGRWSFPEVEREVLNARAEYPYPIIIEDVPWARPLIQRLQQVTWGVIPWKLQGRSKVNRADAVTPLVESGNVYLRNGAKWLPTFIEQHAVFPDGKNDDLVDVDVMALTYLMRNMGRKQTRSTALPFRRNWQHLNA